MTIKKISLMGLSLILLFALTACNGGSDDIFYYTATISVADSSNDYPIEDAEVVLGGETQYTNEWGVVNFLNCSGTCTYTVSKAGYLDKTGTITSDSPTVGVDVSLELVDETDPIVNITSPADEADLGEHNITITWNIEDSSPYTWELYLGGGTNPEVTGDQDDPHTYTFDPADPDYFESYHGVVIFRVEAVDNQDNASSASISVNMETRADLIPDLRGGYYPFELDNEGQVIFYVKNQGNSTAPGSTARVRFYKTDRIVTEYISTPPLNPGESTSLTPVDIPSGVFNPDADFNISVDFYDSVDEADESNNEADCIIVG